ncbi:ABC-2 transporter permease [Anaerococcus sp. AGMB00486]|uniref:ABC-2 transporter permease n=1 Tax=Anaerococcus faecalis TaxID=2742993 RepID=A0ABX2N914_9FIRM|nr:ABC-2 transporter permease [Anaerococcus faecalis]
MKGLIYKDFIILLSKITKKKLLVFISAICIVSIIIETSILPLISISIQFFALSYSLELFEEDNKDRWREYIMTLPVRSKDIVVSRYLSNILILTISFLFTSVISIIKFYLDSKVMLSYMLIFPIIGLIASLIYLSIVNPLNFFLSSNNKRIVSFIIIVIASFTLYLIKRLDSKKIKNIFNIFISNKILLIFLITISTILLIIISIFISIKCLNKNKQEC